MAFEFSPSNVKQADLLHHFQIMQLFLKDILVCNHEHENHLGRKLTLAERKKYRYFKA
jgi:NOL1/NOP2/fmu family ribosome biogenesis protein